LPTDAAQVLREKLASIVLEFRSLRARLDRYVAQLSPTQRLRSVRKYCAAISESFSWECLVQVLLPGKQLRWTVTEDGDIGYLQ
jgi:hypothetical protein